MPRLARVVVPGFPHHVIQRGNRRQAVFFNDGDRVAYLQLLRRACEKHRVSIWAYCLMRNHVHVVAVPEHAHSLAGCFADAHVRYTRRINVREGWQGHLWQARFGSSVMDERYLLAAVRYVERNPIHAGIVRQAWQYRWSSAAWHVGMVKDDPLVTQDQALRALVHDWRTYLEGEEDPKEVAKIDRETFVSRPLGTETFIHELEQLLRRPLMRGRAGRPRRRTKSVAVPD